MKKLLFLVVPFIFLFLLTGCGNKTLSCTVDGDTVKIVYDKEKIISMTEGGEKATKEEIDLMNAALEFVGGIEEFLDMIETEAEAAGGSCSGR